MLKSVLIAAVALASALFVAAPATAIAAKGGSTVRLQAALTGNTAAKGKADYREFQDAAGNTVRRINVEVEHAVPGAVYGVKHNGVVIGQMKIDTFGVGKFSRQSATDDPNKQGFVPDMKAGDKITIGPGICSGILKQV